MIYFKKSILNSSVSLSFSSFLFCYEFLPPITKDLLIIHLRKKEYVKVQFKQSFLSCHSMASGLQCLLLVLRTLLIIAETVLDFAYSLAQRMIFHYQVFNRLVSLLRLLSFNILCKIVASSITNERKSRRAVLALCLFFSQDISLFYLLLYSLCRLSEFSFVLWQREGHLKIILWEECTAVWALSGHSPCKTLQILWAGT